MFYGSERKPMIGMEWKLTRTEPGNTWSDGAAEKVLECLCPKTLSWLGMEGTSGVF